MFILLANNAKMYTKLWGDKVYQKRKKNNIYNQGGGITYDKNVVIGSVEVLQAGLKL